MLKDHGRFQKYKLRICILKKSKRNASTFTHNLNIIKRIQFKYIFYDKGWLAIYLGCFVHFFNDKIYQRKQVFWNATSTYHFIFYTYFYCFFLHLFYWKHLSEEASILKCYTSLSFYFKKNWYSFLPLILMKTSILKCEVLQSYQTLYLTLVHKHKK